MQIGFVGLGKMGYNLALNLHRHGYEVVAYDVVTDNVKNILIEGISPAYSLGEMCQQLDGRKVVWLMVPAGKPVDDCIEALLPHLAPNDIVIDGGNSNFNDSVRRHKYLKSKGFDYSRLRHQWRCRRGFNGCLYDDWR
jgi:6-phosphogluconate dehydrogenase